MKKILFITPYPKGFAPSQRLKFEQYYSTFEDANYKVYHDSFIDIEFWSFVYKKGFLIEGDDNRKVVVDFGQGLNIYSKDNKKKVVNIYGKKN